MFFFFWFHFIIIIIIITSIRCSFLPCERAHHSLFFSSRRTGRERERERERIRRPGC